MRQPLLVGLVAVAACTHHRTVTSTNITGRSVTVVTSDYRELAGVVQPSADGSLVLHTAQGEVSLPSGTRLTEVRRGIGALEGLAIGGLIGVTGGAIIGYAEGDDTCESDHCWGSLTREGNMFVAGIGFGILGGLVGVVAGAALGSDFVYEIRSQSRFTPTGPPGSVAGASVPF